MGRSQVARNRALGRPGSKGSTREQGNRGGTKKHQRDLGDNTWRYEIQKHNREEIEEFSIDDRTGYHEYGYKYRGGMAYSGAFYDTIQNLSFSDLKNETVSIHSKSSHEFMNINVLGLARCLDKMKTSEWMRISSRIAESFDLKFNDEISRKITVREMNMISQVTCHDRDVVIASGGEQDCEEETNSQEKEKSFKDIDLSAQESKTASKISDCSREEDEEKEVEEDLDSWLDDMIS